MPAPDYSAIYADRKAAEAAALRPRVVKAADIYEVMREQLAFLIAHVQDGPCHGCEACQRFLEAKEVLVLEAFDDAFENPDERPFVMSAGGLRR